MTSELSYFVFSLLLCAVASAAIATWHSLLAQRRREWHELVADLNPVDLGGLSTVATDYLTPRRGQIDLEPEQIWASLGGYNGLKKMRRNAEIMLALAAYAQRWNFAEAVIVTERMRHDAALLCRAVRRAELCKFPAILPRRYRFTLPLHAQEASAAYYLMRQRLLSLYETSHAGLYPALAASL
ncbi:MAG: hypothetical protein ACP5FH_02825 [Terracidiphilus sp.]